MNLANKYQGKKIIFVYPPLFLENGYIVAKTGHELEMYVLDDHSKLSFLLNSWPECFIFINIDRELTISDWEIFIDGLGSHSDLEKADIGILTKETDSKKFETIFLSSTVNAGIIHLTDNIEIDSENIINKLKEFNVFGLRKNIRVDCDNPTTRMDVIINDRLFTGILLDVSLAGIAVVFARQIPLVKGDNYVGSIMLSGQIIKAKLHFIGSKTEQPFVKQFAFEVSNDDNIKDIKQFIRLQLNSNLAKAVEKSSNNSIYGDTNRIDIVKNEFLLNESK